MNEPLLKGKRCIVVGSSPDSFVFGNPDIIIGANGGVGIATRAGHCTQILCTTAYICREPPSQSELDSIKTWQGKTFESSWVDTTDGPSSWFTSRKEDYHFQSKNDVFVSSARRMIIVREACGLDLGWNSDPYKRVSTGVFAACLAVVSDVEDLLITGVSVNASRHHGEADIRCLTELASDNFDKIYTTSAKLGDATGMRVR